MGTTEEDSVLGALALQPMQLFKPNEDHSRLEIVPDTLRALAAIKNPCQIVTIVGTQRGGKSTLLNLLKARKTAGFGLGHYMDAQTVGLWIWGRPHPRDSDVQVLLMDTEGLDSPHIPQWYNWTLSAVALLISSYFIYQTKGSIDSNAVDRLGAILRVADQLRGSDANSEKPKFLWLIRDHQLAMKRAPKDEMMDKLEAQSSKALQRCFESSDCFPLPRPVVRDDLLQDVEKLGWEELTEDFREEYVVLERQIFSAIQNPRKLSGQMLTGEILASLVGKYSQAINAKDGILTELSQLPTQRQMIVQLTGERAVKTAMEVYKQSMEEIHGKFPVSEDELNSAHDEAYAAAFQRFEAEALLDADDRSETQQFIDNFQRLISEWNPLSSSIGERCVRQKQLVGGVYFSLWNENMRISRAKCEQAIKTFYKPIEEKLKTGGDAFASLSQFRQEIEDIKTMYNEGSEARGIAKNLIYDKFFETREYQDSQIVIGSLLRREFAQQLQDSKKEIQNLLEAIGKQGEMFQLALKEQGQALQRQLDASVQASKEFQATSANSIERLKSGVDDQGRTFGEKLSTLHDSLHKQDVQVALNSQAIASIGPQVEGMQSEMKGIPALQYKVEGLESSANSRLSQYEKALSDLEASTLMSLSNLRTDVEAAASSSEILASEIQLASSRRAESTEKVLEDLSQKIVKTGDGLEEVSKRCITIEAAVEQRLQESSKRMDTLQSNASELQKQITQGVESLSATLREELSQRLSDSAKDTREKLEQLTAQLHEGVEELRQTQKIQRSYLDDEVIKKFQETIASVGAEVQAAKESLSTATLEWHEKVQTISGSVQQLDRDLSAVSQELRSSQVSNQDAHDQEVERLEKVEKLTQTLEHSLGLIDKDMADVKNISVQIDQMQAEVKAIKVTSEEGTAIVGELKSQGAQSKQSTEATLNDLHQQIQLVNTRVKTNVQAIDNFSSKIEHVKSDLADQSTLSTEQIKRLSDQLDKDIKLVLVELKKMKNPEDMLRHLEHVKQSMDALWSSIGVLSGRIVDVEATVDKLK